MPERKRHNQVCTHDLCIITMRRLHIAEYTVRRGEVEPYLEHTHPVHEIYIRCQGCIYEHTYDPREVPAWLQPYLDKIAEGERLARRTALLAELTEPIELHLLDKLLDAGVDPELLVGKTADWHGEPFPLVQLQDGRIAIQVVLTCAKCHTEQTTVYVGSGLHAGAFCYVFSSEGEYQANLRDQEYICETCEQQRPTTATRIKGGTR